MVRPQNHCIVPICRNRVSQAPVALTPAPVRQPLPITIKLEFPGTPKQRTPPITEHFTITTLQSECSLMTAELGES